MTVLVYESTDQFDFSALTTATEDAAGGKLQSRDTHARDTHARDKTVAEAVEMVPRKPLASVRMPAKAAPVTAAPRYDQMAADAQVRSERARDDHHEGMAANIYYVNRHELESRRLRRAARSMLAPIPSPADVKHDIAHQEDVRPKHTAPAEHRPAEIEIDEPAPAPIFRHPHGAPFTLRNFLLASAVAAPVAYCIAIASSPSRPDVSIATTAAPIPTELVGLAPLRQSDHGPAIDGTTSGSALNDARVLLIQSEDIAADAPTGAQADGSATGPPSGYNHPSNISEADKLLVERNRRFHEAGNAVEVQLLYGRTADDRNSRTSGVGTSQDQVDARPPADAGAAFARSRTWYEEASEFWFVARTFAWGGPPLPQGIDDRFGWMPRGTSANSAATCMQRVAACNNRFYANDSVIARYPDWDAAVLH